MSQQEHTLTLSDNKEKDLYFIFAPGTIRYRECSNFNSTVNITDVLITEDWLNVLIAFHLNSGSYLSSGLKIQYKAKIVAYTFVEFKKYYDFCKSLTPAPPAPTPEEHTVEQKINQQIEIMKIIEGKLQDFFPKPFHYPLTSKNEQYSKELQHTTLIFEKVGDLHYCNVATSLCRMNCLISGSSMLEVLHCLYSMEKLLIEYTEYNVADLNIYGLPVMTVIKAKSAYIIYCAEKQPTEEQISRRVQLIYQNVSS
jgi:hypothetical protein